MRILVTAAALALGLATPALAGSAADAKACAETQMKVNSAIAASDDQALIIEAAGHRDEGDAACAAGKYRQGIAHYNIALKLLGAKMGGKSAPPPRPGY